MWCSVVQHVAVRCCVLQCLDAAAVCLQYSLVYHSMLQCVAVCRSVLQYVAVCHTINRVTWIMTDSNGQSHVHEWVMTHIWMNHDTHLNESWHTSEWVMSHIWTRYAVFQWFINQPNEIISAFVIWLWLCLWSLVTGMIASCHRCVAARCSVL